LDTAKYASNRKNNVGINAVTRPGSCADASFSHTNWSSIGLSQFGLQRCNGGGVGWEGQSILVSRRREAPPDPAPHCRTVRTAAKRADASRARRPEVAGEGHGNKDVATTLDVSVKTVHTHRANAMRKLKLRTYSDLIQFAIRHKIIEMA
jgi:hypothetical protein